VNKGERGRVSVCRGKVGGGGGGGGGGVRSASVPKT